MSFWPFWPKIHIFLHSLPVASIYGYIRNSKVRTRIIEHYSLIWWKDFCSISIGYGDNGDSLIRWGNLRFLPIYIYIYIIYLILTISFIKNWKLKKIDTHVDITSWYETVVHVAIAINYFNLMLTAHSISSQYIAYFTLSGIFSR